MDSDISRENLLIANNQERNQNHKRALREKTNPEGGDQLCPLISGEAKRNQVPADRSTLRRTQSGRVDLVRNKTDRLLED